MPPIHLFKPRLCLKLKQFNSFISGVWFHMKLVCRFNHEAVMKKSTCRGLQTALAVLAFGFIVPEQKMSERSGIKGLQTKQKPKICKAVCMTNKWLTCS